MRLVDEHGVRPAARMLGVHFATMQKWANGTRRPNKLTLEAIAQRMKGVR